jgi:UPF0716 protein FxsA
MTRTLRFGLPAYLLLEAYVTLQIAAWLGGGRTLLLLLLGVMAGLVVLRREQLSILARLRRTAASGERVLPNLVGGALRVAAGILLIVPGFVSDMAGLALLIPVLRRRLVAGILPVSADDPSGPTVIEGEYRRVDDPALPRAKQEHG